MQPGSIPQWTCVLVSLLASGSFPTSALILLGLNLMPFPFFFFPFSSLSLHKAHPSPSLPSLSPPPLPLSAPRDTKKDAELHCYIFVYLTYSFYLLPPLSELGPVVICITWPLLQGTSASLSPELWYWNDSSPRELNRVSVEMHWGKSVQQEACRIARYSEEWRKEKHGRKKTIVTIFGIGWHFYDEILIRCGDDFAWENSLMRNYTLGSVASSYVEAENLF